MSKLVANPPGTASVINHPAHPYHSLMLTAAGDSTFLCDRCRCHGSGLRYRCDRCGFDLHEYCATCPPNLPFFFAHPRHTLTLEPFSDCGYRWDDTRRDCDFCRGAIKGESYRCRQCCFDLHPLCAQLPPVAEGSAFHPEHALALVPAVPRPCSACRKECVGWRYCCEPCHIHLHPGCLHATKSIVAAGQKRTTVMRFGIDIGRRFGIGATLTVDRNKVK